MSSSTLEIGDVALIGAVHASRNSRDEIHREISARSPDVVAVELDPPRYTAMKDGGTTRSDPLNLALSVANGDLNIRGALASYLFGRHQAKIFEALDLQPGEADMLPAIRAGHEAGADTVLIDLQIGEVMNSLGESFAPSRLLWNLLDEGIVELLSSYDSLQDVAERNNLTDIDSVAGAVEQFDDISYEDLDLIVDAYDTLLPDGALDEILHHRNEAMAGRLYWLQQQGESIIAVMGKLHVPGVRNHLENPASIRDDYIRPPPYIEHTETE